MAWIGGAAILLAVPILLFSQRIYLPIARSPMRSSVASLGGAWSQAIAAHDAWNLLIALILLIAAAACIARFPAGVAAAGAALILVALAVYLDVAVGRTQMFSQLMRQAAWLNDAYLFDSTYLPRNVAAEPLRSQFRLDTVWDRLVTGWYFMGFGWNLALGAGLAMFLAAARTLQARACRWIIFLSLAGGVALLVFYLSGPLLAQRAFVNGALAEADGRPRAAIELYSRAIHGDRWLAMDLQLRRRIGALESGQGRTATPDARVYYAEQLVAQSSAPGAIGQLPRAIALYDSLAAEDPIWL